MLQGIEHPGDCTASPMDGCKGCEAIIKSRITQELPRSKEIQSQGDYPHGYYLI